MGIKIRPGKTENARQELCAFIAAFPVNQVGQQDGYLLFWLPADREDEATCFEDMELNSFGGTFDIMKYMEA